MSEKILQKPIVSADIFSKAHDLLYTAFLQNKLSHAYLLSGAAGLGKTDFARDFGRFLLCANSITLANDRSRLPQKLARQGERMACCETCRNCQLTKANTHPDFILIAPEEKNHSIKIDQIRVLSDKLSRTAQLGGYQVVIISPADSMPMAAANALLKTLEEPAGKVILLLIDNQRSQLPPTIVSRCQKILFANHLDLRLYNNALTLRDELLRHLQHIVMRRVNAVTINPSWLKIPLENTLRQLILLCNDIARVQMGIVNNYIVNHDVISPLSTIAEKILPVNIQLFMQKCLEKKALVASGINLNQQLCLEALFIAWEDSIAD